MKEALLALAVALFAHGAVAKTNAFLNTAAATTLGRYPEGIKVLNTLRPGAEFAGVEILFADRATVEGRNGHNGGGLLQIGDDYKVLVTDGLPDAQSAHAVAHELQHLRDERDFDAFLKNKPELNAIGPRVIEALNATSTRAAYIPTHRADVDFVAKGLFCQELRAYEVNKRLNDQGLAFQNTQAVGATIEFVNQSYVRPLGVTYSVDELRDTASRCRSFAKFSDFMASLAPTTVGAHTPGDPSGK